VPIDTPSPNATAQKSVQSVSTIPSRPTALRSSQGRKEKSK